MRIPNHTVIPRASWKILIVILAVGGALRFYGLDIQSLWNDELATWRIANYDSLGEVVEFGLLPDCHPPGYEALIFWMKNQIGDSEAILRLPSAVAGTLSILLIFLLGTRMYSRREGLIAAAMLAVSWCPIYYSQEARAYSLLLCLTLFSSLLLSILLERFSRDERFSLPLASGYALCAIALCYLHYFGLFLVVLQASVMVGLCRRRRPAVLSCLLMYAVIALAYLPWLPIMQVHLARQTTWIPVPHPRAFPGYLKFIFGASVPMLLLVSAFFLSLALRSTREAWRNRNGLKGPRAAALRTDLFLALWLVVPLGLIYVKSQLSLPVFTYRNLIICLPPAYLLLARAVTRIPVRRSLHALLATGLVALCFANLAFVRKYYSEPQKQQWREAISFVTRSESRAPDPLVLGFGFQTAHFDYYFQKQASSLRMEYLAGETKDIGWVSRLIDERQPDYIWYISAHRIPEQGFVDFLADRSRTTQHVSFVGAGVWLFSGVGHDGIAEKQVREDWMTIRETAGSKEPEETRAGGRTVENRFRYL